MFVRINTLLFVSMCVNIAFINAQQTSSIIINEVMSSNIDVYLDPSQNYGGWVELYNTSSKSIPLGGLYISDDKTNLRKHRLSSTYGSLPPNGFALLNFEHHNNFTKEGFRQIDFKLDCDGGIIIISDGTNIFAEQRYPSGISRISYARVNDGLDKWNYTGNPTPGYSNNGNGGFAREQLSPPTVSPDGCLFQSTLQVTVNVPKGSSLRYTLDGTCPTLTNGYTADNYTFSISTSTCYRFRLFKDGYLPSPVVTRSYIKETGNHPFPIISIVTDTANFYDKDRGLFEIGPYGRSGRYTNETYNSNMDWDRPVSFEYITTDNKCVVSQECDFAMTGGWSRMVSPHAFKLKAKKQYDFQNYFGYQFFEEKPYLKHKTLLIRSGGDDHTWRVIDVAFQQMIAQSGIRVNYQSFEPVQVFINCKPYAVLNLREPSNKDFVYSNYGIDDDELDQFEMSPDSGYIQVRGTKESFNTLMSLSEHSSDSTTYNSIRNILDIEDFINYMAIQFYIGNSDWPFNNLKGFRDRKDGRFHFVLFDLDGVFNTKSPFDIFFDMETRQNDPLYGFDYSQNVSIDGNRLIRPIEIVTLFRNLLKNPSFRKQFIDTICIVGGSVFKQDHVVTAMEKLNTRMTKGGLQDPTGMTNYFKRHLSLTFNLNRMKEMEACSQIDITSPRQHVRITSNIKNSTILVNNIELPYSDFDGFLYGPITLHALSPKGYEFTCWKDQTNGHIISTSSYFRLPTSDSLNFDACFSPNSVTSTIPIRVNEISANNTIYVNEYFKKNDWIELYNTTEDSIDVCGMYLSDDQTSPHKYQIQSSSSIKNIRNTIIPPHGYLVVWADQLFPINQIHSGFGLRNSDKEIVMLTASDDSWHDTLTYSFHPSSYSFGRYPDGCDATYLLNVPTIGKKNIIDSYSELVDYSALKGDVNCDGKVDISDIVAIINEMSGTVIYSNSDVNNDRQVDISDVISVINIISK